MVRPTPDPEPRESPAATAAAAVALGLPAADAEAVPVTPAVAETGAAASAAAAQAEHRATRKRRLHVALLTSLVARPLAVVIQLVSLPLFIRYLGPEGFGLYESVAALAVWLALTNAGLSMGLQNRLQDCYVSGDRALARRYVSSLTIALVVIAAAGLVVLSVVTPLVDWGRVFPTDAVRPVGETAWAFWVAGALTLVGVAVSTPYSIYAAYQELHVANVWDGAAKVLTLGACVAVVYTGFGLVGVVLASTGVYVAVRAVNAAWVFGWEKPWLRPSLRVFDGALLKVALAEGVYLFGLQMATGLIVHVDKLIIANRLGAGDVAAYAVVGRLFLLVHSVFVLIQWPLWPAYGEAIRRGDVAWARRMIRLMLVATTLGTVAWGAALYFFGGPIVGFVSHGERVDVSRSLIVAVTAFFVVRSWAECQSVPLNAAGVIKPQIGILLANGVLNTALALALVGPFGVVGVAWAFPISALLTSVWGYPALIRRHLSAGVGTSANRSPPAAAAAATGGSSTTGAA